MPAHPSITAECCWPQGRQNSPASAPPPPSDRSAVDWRAGKNASQYASLSFSLFSHPGAQLCAGISFSYFVYGLDESVAGKVTLSGNRVVYLIQSDIPLSRAVLQCSNSFIIRSYKL